MNVAAKIDDEIKRVEEKRRGEVYKEEKFKRVQVTNSKKKEAKKKVHVNIFKLRFSLRRILRLITA